ncbi:TPA: formate--tetrahydrofolate ligase, partial [Escherichia coli]|nr:formate--tetrahydrofolate ligase [Escherichia coli]
AKDQLKEENLEAVKAGIVNLERHVNNVKKYGLEPVIALNAFIHDTEAETEFVKQWAQEQGVRIALTEVWEKGGKGGVDLAHHVLEVIDQPQTFKHLYELEQPLESKIE